MKYTVTMVLTADSIEAFKHLTLGKVLDGGATIQSFGVGDYIEFADKVRGPIDNQDHPSEIVTAARKAVELHDANVNAQFEQRKATK